MWNQSLGREDPLGEEMANPLWYSWYWYSGILGIGILVFLPEEFCGPGELQSLWSQRVRHD